MSLRPRFWARVPDDGVLLLVEYRLGDDNGPLGKMVDLDMLVRNLLH